MAAPISRGICPKSLTFGHSPHLSTPEERTHWVLRQTRWVLRKTRWVRFGTQIRGCVSRTGLSTEEATSSNILRSVCGQRGKTNNQEAKPSWRLLSPPPKWIQNFIFIDTIGMDTISLSINLLHLSKIPKHVESKVLQCWQGFHSLHKLFWTDSFVCTLSHVSWINNKRGGWNVLETFRVAFGSLVTFFVPFSYRNKIVWGGFRSADVPPFQRAWGGQTRLYPHHRRVDHHRQRKSSGKWSAVFLEQSVCFSSPLATHH